ncbi:phage baseplate assembly protein V [Lentzea sp. NPDC059081]|uniref:phage baseplate assembly protein V n=1 Tax=Lentzea sp. NPDC059081 TaxID=3346719 RepID=UPI00369F4D61
MSMDELSVSVSALVRVNGMPLPMSAPEPVRVVVDSHQHLPGMFEITFADPDGTALDDAGLEIGAVVEISDGADETVLITGEVTALEAHCVETIVHSVVRGYEKSHRLQRARHSRTFVNQTDSDIARDLALEAGLTIGRIDPTGLIHDHLGQVAQTNWEFLRARAQEIGYEMRVAEGAFFFRKVSGRPKLGLLGGVTAAFGEDLVTFHPRVTAANLASSAEVRMWDPARGRAVVGRARVSSETATLDGLDPETLARKFEATRRPKKPQGGLPSARRLAALAEAAAGGSAVVVVDRPAAQGADAQRSADRMASSLAERVASGFAEASGLLHGNPEVLAGCKLTVEGVPSPFAATWTVTRAEHVFDLDEGGYYTHFEVSGRQERSLLGLTSRGPSAQHRIDGVVCGVVTDVADPQERGRVKVSLPWLAADYVTDWARTVHFGLGATAGAMFLPEVNDEVLVAFELGDPRRPYVVGGLNREQTKLPSLGPHVTGKGEMAQVVERGFYTPTGSHLVFQDDLPPSAGSGGTGPVKASKIVLGGAKDQLALTIDHQKGTVDLACAPKSPVSKAPSGKITISCGAGGTVTVSVLGQGKISLNAAGGTVEVVAANLDLKGSKGVKIASGGSVQISAPSIKLN